MELEEMKSAWASMSDELEKQKKLNRDLINEMAQRKSKTYLGNLIRYERMGMVVIAFMSLGILFNLDEITGWINIVCTIGVFAVFAFGIYLSQSFITKAQKIDVINSSVKQVHHDFNQCYVAYRKMKKGGMIIGVVLLIFFLPVASIVIGGKDITGNLAEYTESLIASFILFPIVIFVIMKIYNRNMNAVKKVMEELEE